MFYVVNYDNGEVKYGNFNSYYYFLDYAVRYNLCCYFTIEYYDCESDYFNCLYEVFTMPKSVRNPPKNNEEKVETKKYACCILYPDSTTYNVYSVISELSNQHISFAVSPIHDRDIKEDGSIKKAHYHFLVSYPNATTLNNFRNIFEVCGLQKSDLHMVELCYSGVGYFRYLTHKDNPEKAQYNDNDIRIFNDYNGIFEKFKKTEKDKTDNLVRIFQLVDELDTVSFHSLMQYLMFNEVELFKMITSSSALAICIKEYQRSLEYDKKHLKE